MKFAKFTLAFLLSVLGGKEIIAQPIVSSVTPSTAVPGSSVVISGSNFNSAPGSNVVYFGSIRASITIIVTTSLTVDLHNRRLYEPISIIT